MTRSSASRRLLNRAPGRRIPAGLLLWAGWIAAVLALGGCQLMPLRVDVATDCAWTVPIKADAPTKAFLGQLYDPAGKPRLLSYVEAGRAVTIEAPPGFALWLDRIGKHNEKVETNCPARS